MLPKGLLDTALASIALTAAHGPWSRIVGLRHLLGPPPGLIGLPQPLWGGAARLAGARFTPAGGFVSIYLASDPLTALAEVQALVLLPGGPATLRSAPWAVLTVEGVIGRVLDLTAPSTLDALDTNAQEVTGAWASMAQPPTQRLAQAAYDSGRIAAIRYGSVKSRDGLNLVVFPDRLVSPSTDFLEVYDPHGTLAQRIGG